MVAKRYGCLPSELLSLPLDEWSLNAIVAAHGVKKEIEAIKRLK